MPPAPPRRWDRRACHRLTPGSATRRALGASVRRKSWPFDREAAGFPRAATCEHRQPPAVRIAHRQGPAAAMHSGSAEQQRLAALQHPLGRPARVPRGAPHGIKPPYLARLASFFLQPSERRAVARKSILQSWGSPTLTRPGRNKHADDLYCSNCTRSSAPASAQPDRRPAS